MKNKMPTTIARDIPAFATDGKPLAPENGIIKHSNAIRYWCKIIALITKPTNTRIKSSIDYFLGKIV